MSNPRLRMLILGGYGTFGGRLAQLLADEERLLLIIAGRSQARAEAFCRGLSGCVGRMPLRFDRDGEIESQLAQIRADLVVDATGPFQSYGDDPYRVVKACLRLGMHYMDFADGSEFVKGIGRFDAEARAKNVHVLSGVSSFPVLSAAVVRSLSRDLVRVRSIIGGIAPSPYANVGPNVIRAIAGYSGKPVSIRRAGRAIRAYALMDTMRYTVCPPGSLPLRNLQFSLVDVPDLRIFPELWPSLETLWMGAGPLPAILHRILNGCAWLVRLKLLPSLQFLAPLMYRTTNTLRWGEHRGGMFIAIAGVDAGGKEVERSWHLTAEAERGPYIPSMSIEALVRRHLAGDSPAPGARPATNELELQDYESLFLKRAIRTGRWDSPADAGRLPLYRRLLGNAWGHLPSPLQAMHSCHGELRAAGRATVERGRGLLARTIAALLGFPKAGDDVPVQVHFRAHRGGEIWRRTFGRKSFSSVQTAGRGRSERLLTERFGPVAVGMALVIEDEQLHLVVRRWSVLGLPLPARFAPGGRSYEFVQDGRFRFHVEIAHGLTGPIVTYRGWLEPQSSAGAPADRNCTSTTFAAAAL